ncbi:hypothetical protein HDU97_004541 [Phlyctochytrium planicorne]|nr:hypothetical protein HDU97_004541 [Phlyctochytrium planicorne]
MFPKCEGSGSTTSIKKLCRTAMDNFVLTCATMLPIITSKQPNFKIALDDPPNCFNDLQKFIRKDEEQVEEVVEEVVDEEAAVEQELEQESEQDVEQEVEQAAEEQQVERRDNHDDIEEEIQQQSQLSEEEAEERLLERDEAAEEFNLEDAVGNTNFHMDVFY